MTNLVNLITNLPKDPDPISKETPCLYNVYEIAELSLNNSEAKTLYYVAGIKQDKNGNFLLASRERLKSDIIPCDNSINIKDITYYQSRGS
jgi:hypothetical protein